VRVDGDDTDRLAGHQAQGHASLLVGIRDIAGKSCESEVWAFRQDNGGLETLQPLVRLLGLQFDKESRLGLDICQSTFCWDLSSTELFLLISLVRLRNGAGLTEHPASS
jgi:hypothetical protein